MNKVIEFLTQHKCFYEQYFEKDRLKKCNYGYTCDINQIYCYLKLVDIKKTEYYEFYKLSKKYFNIKNCKILEVGCGYIPILASIYGNNNIKIDAINDKILINKFKNVKTIEYNLNNNYNIKNYDLVIGFRPCSITENIIELCNKYNKNFMIYMCPCIHNPKNSTNKFSTYEEWINYIVEKINDFNRYNLIILKKENMPDNCPIIIAKLKS